ncbi:MAG TPA: AtpZ/AtpI family protein [Fimbriimonadaceae bacterium]|nr:AtpZ/AtpI family protein [Fimbriimonadaceae bacterium]
MPDEHDEDVDEIERELERRMAQFRLREEDGSARSKFPEPPTDEEIEARLESMRSKISEAGQSRMPEPPEFEVKRPRMLQQQPADKHGYRSLGIGMTAAYALVGMMILGVGLGWLLDHGSNSANVGPALGGLAGCVVGIGFVIWLINRDQSR